MSSGPRKIKSVLIANRGEIACRIIRSCQKLGIKTVAVYSEADAGALHRLSADKSILLGASAPSESYLNQEKLIAIARSEKVDALHPGYGFLSENGIFAAAVERAGIVFIGPSGATINTLGDKVRSKAIARKLGVPLAPEYEAGELGAFDQKGIERFIGDCGLPVIVKAAAGGGGRGMRKVWEEKDLVPALEAASREAKGSFGDGRVFVEKLIQGARHVEVQIAADNFGETRSIFDRDCTMQRRHQKVIEEAPASKIDAKVRAAIHDSAVKICKEVGYRNLGTVEFLLDVQSQFYFLEVNSRLQVEHPVTELISGLDLVELQVKIASEERLSSLLKGMPPTPIGTAIEVRLCAEIPESDFLSASGKLDLLHFPEGIRVDTGYLQGDRVPYFYDSLLAKLVTHAEDRKAATAKLCTALEQCTVAGVQTNSAFISYLLHTPEFITGTHHISLAEGIVEQYSPNLHLSAGTAFALLSAEGDNPLDSWAGFSPFRIQGQAALEVELDVGARRGMIVITDLGDGNYHAKGFETEIKIAKSDLNARLLHTSSGIWVKLSVGAFPVSVVAGSLNRASATGLHHRSDIRSPFPGKVVSIFVKEGEIVEAGASLLAIESMKMEHPVRAPVRAVVSKISVTAGQVVEGRRLLLELEDL